MLQATIPFATTTLDAHVAERAQAILAKRRRKSTARAVDARTRLCAVIATLPRKVKVQDVAPLFGLTPSHLSRLRGQAFRGTMAFPEELRAELAASYVPRERA